MQRNDRHFFFRKIHKEDPVIVIPIMHQEKNTKTGNVEKRLHRQIMTVMFDYMYL